MGGEFLVRASVGMSLKLNLSRMVIGLTVVSFATSAPELIVSINAALDGSPAIAVGNVVGSNIANIGLVLAITGLISPLAIDRDFYRFNFPWMTFFTVVLIVMLLANASIDRWGGLLLLVILVIFIVLLLRRARKSAATMVLEEELQVSYWWKIALFLLIGGGALWGGSELLVRGAVGIATTMNIPESVVAVSMVAVGTSVPELAASVIAAIKKEKAISLGNLIGSNIFNIASVLGITALIEPISISAADRLIHTDIWWMLGFALVLLPLGLIAPRYVLSRWKNALILIFYLIFIVTMIATL